MVLKAKNSLNIGEFKKRQIKHDKITDFKCIDEVEKMVILLR